MMKLTFETDHMTYSLSREEKINNATASDQGWLFGEVIRVCSCTRNSQVLAEIVRNLEEDLDYAENSDVSDACKRMVLAADDVIEAWAEYDQQSIGDRVASAGEAMSDGERESGLSGQDAARGVR